MRHLVLPERRINSSIQTFRSRMRPTRPWLAAAFLLTITFLAYIHVIRAGGFVLDDNDYITNGSPLLSSLRGLQYIWTRVGSLHGGTLSYYPLTYSVLWAEFHIFAFRPLGYHLANILLHSLNSILLWRILRRLRVPGALLAAAIFAVHPVNVESVAWITELKNILSGLFYLLSFLFYLRFLGVSGPGSQTAGPPSSYDSALWPHTAPAESRGRQRLFYCLSIFLFLCALTGKTSTVVLPAIILLLIWWQAGSIAWKDILPLSPMLVLAAGAGLVTMYVENHAGAAWALPPAGEGGTAWGLTPVQHCLLAGRIVWFYAAKLIWPLKLMCFYPRWKIDQTVWQQYLFPITALLVFAVLWLGRRKTGRGPLAAVLAFVVPLLPVMGFLDVYFMQFSYVADHFQYLASMGLITLFAAAATLACRRLTAGSKKAVLPAAGALLLMLGLLTWRQSGIYENTDQIWLDTLKKNPSCWVAHDRLGVSLVRQGKAEEAIAHYREALRLKPDFANVHYNWGVALAGQGKIEEAIAHYREALRLDSDLAGVHDNWGVILAGQGKVKEAIAHYHEALRIKPGFAGAHDHLGIALAGQGKVEEAIAHYREALRITPDFADAHYNLGVDLARMGKTEEAITHYREALRLDPNFAEAHDSWGTALARLGKTEEAVTQYREALRLKPGLANPHNNWGVALSGQGKVEEAIVHYREALRLDPGFAAAHYNLGVDLAGQGKLGEAAAQYREVLRLNPDLTAARNELKEILDRSDRRTE